MPRRRFFSPCRFSIYSPLSSLSRLMGQTDLRSCLRVKNRASLPSKSLLFLPLLSPFAQPRLLSAEKFEKSPPLLVVSPFMVSSSFFLLFHIDTKRTNLCRTMVMNTGLDSGTIPGVSLTFPPFFFWTLRTVIERMQVVERRVYFSPLLLFLSLFLRPAVALELRVRTTKSL